MRTWAAVKPKSNSMRWSVLYFPKNSLGSRESRRILRIKSWCRTGSLNIPTGLKAALVKYSDSKMDDLRLLFLPMKRFMGPRSEILVFSIPLKFWIERLVIILYKEEALLRG